MALVRPDGSASVPIQRSPLFRERKVRIELWGPTTGVPVGASTTLATTKPVVVSGLETSRTIPPNVEGVSTAPTDTAQIRTGVVNAPTAGGEVSPAAVPPLISIDLTEVRSIRPSSQGATAVMNGVVGPVIQPWYFGPIVMEIRGESYMGAFKNRALNVAVDNDVEKLWRLREIVNERFALSAETIRGLKVVLTIGDSGPENMATNQKFWGNIDNLETEENDDKPYVWTYGFRFTGDFWTRFVVESGTQGVGQDLAVASGATSTGLGMIPQPAVR